MERISQLNKKCFKLRTRPIEEKCGIKKSDLLIFFRTLVKSKYPELITQIHLNEKTIPVFLCKYPELKDEIER